LFEVWDQTTETLRTLFTHPAEKGSFPEHIHTFALHLLELLDCQPDISIYRTVRQDNAQNFYYGYSHAVHTAVLCIFLCRHLQWTQNRMMTLAKAALTMNMSIMELQGQMAAQDVPMKDKQRAEIRSHPAKTVELLKSLGITDADWLQAIAQHHEHPDGTGYPEACSDMSEMAVALRVTDIFMAKISPRALRAALTPQDAVRQLYKEDKGGPISTAIIKEFGIYPPGDFVKLATGELGIVVQRTSNARAPIVAVITDGAGHPVTKTIRRDTGEPGHGIKDVAINKAMLARLPPERLYGFVKAPAPR
jgi:HD-GYP domain-containing protein (c-di-GMP phosphodiesterase class II)